MKTIIATAALTALAGVATAAPSSFIDLGSIGSEGDYTFDTNGSVGIQGNFGSTNADTVMALWDSSGNLLAENDDNGAGGLWSQIDANLTAGEYFIGITEFIVTWDANFTTTSGLGGYEDGDIHAIDFNIDTALAWEGDVGLDSAAGFDNNIQFLRVEVVPAPGAAALAGLAGLAAVRRRR